MLSVQTSPSLLLCCGYFVVTVFSAGGRERAAFFFSTLDKKSTRIDSQFPHCNCAAFHCYLKAQLDWYPRVHMHLFSYVAMHSCTVFAHRTKRTLGHSACDLSLVTEEGYKPLKRLCVHEQASTFSTSKHHFAPITFPQNDVDSQLLLFFCCPLLLFVVRVGVGGGGGGV